MLILIVPVTLRLINSVNYLCTQPLALFLTYQSIFHRNINRQKILRTWEIKSCPNMADEPSFFAQIGQKRSQQCREDSHTAFLQSVLQRDLINNFKPGAFEWLADFTFNLLPYLHKGSCSLPLSKISEIQHFQFFHLSRVFYVILDDLVSWWAKVWVVDVIARAYLYHLSMQHH